MNNNIHSAESVKLLNGALSTSESEMDIQFATAPPVVNHSRRKVRTKRRSKLAMGRAETSEGFLCSACAILKIAAVTFCIGGTTILTWLVLMLQSEVQLLTTRLTTASYSNSNLTTLIFENKHNIEQVMANQTAAWITIWNMSDQNSAFSKQSTTLKADLKELKEALKEVSQVSQLGKELEELKSSLATFGSEFSIFKADFERLGVSSLSRNLVEMNGTLHSKIQWAIEDLHGHHELIVGLQDGMKNLTTEFTVARDSSSQQFDNLSNRVNALHSALTVLETQQRNSTQTVRYILDLLQEFDNERKNSTVRSP